MRATAQSYRLTPDEFAALQTRVLGLALRVREVCLEKLATFGGPEAVRTNLPLAPTLDEALATNLPPPPNEPSEPGHWAAPIAERAETRAHESERRGREERLRKGEAKGEAKGLRAAVLDACELLGLAPTEAQRASLDAVGVGELEALRAALKQHRCWPT